MNISKRRSAGIFQEGEASMASKSHKHNVVHVVPHDDGWAVKKTHAERNSAVLHLQEDAIARARELAGQGEVIIHGANGKIRKA
jgi:hypothetical protein